VLKTSNSRFGVLVSVPGLVALIAIIVFPVLFNVYVSFLRYDNITPIRFVGLKNYAVVLSSTEFLNSLRVSVTYSLSSTALAFVLGLIIAYSLTRIKKAQTLFRTLVILPWAVPLVVSGFMWRWIFDTDIGVLNHILVSLNFVDEKIAFLSHPQLAMIAGILATAYVYIPFMMIYLLAGMENIRDEFYEAATVDGADNVQQFWYITAPLIRKQAVFAFLLILMITVRAPDIFFALTGGGPGKSTYHIGLFLKDTMYKFLRFGHGSTIGVVLTALTFAIAFPLFYFTLTGRTDGGE